MTVLPEQEAGANGTVAEADDSCDGSARSLAEPTSILLVEDDEGDALIVRRVLAASAPPGWKLSVAVRLDDARQWLLANTAECILLDLSLPDAVGLESVEGIHSAAPEVPIVVLSGLDDELMARASLKHGAQDYLTKGNVESVSLWKAIRYAAERKHTEMVIRHQAEHDALTGLANRSMFVDRLKLAISRLGRTGMQVGVLFIDLDRFKWVNDSLGHEVGDELIVEVARRISRVLRPGDLAARLGGDEFLVLVDNVTKPQDVLAVARRMHAALGVPFEIGDRELRVTASVGISLTADPRTDPVTAVRDADVALYRAKAHGKARSELFDAELSALARARLELEGELHRAVERQEFLVHYQPVVDLRDGHVVGAEALVRWMHPSGRLVGPKEFIAVAEEIGLIVDIGEFVLRNACEQVKKWQTAGHAVPLVSVNLSPRQLSDPQLADRLATILAETGVDPGSLCLEVTENGILADEEATWESLRRLSAMGIRLGLDDFGTGYSSLTHLRRYAFDILKVDQSFTAGLGVDAGDTAIVEAVVALARVLKMQVVVEGVETPMQADYLRRLGCELAQGFLFAKPAPAAEVVLH